MHDQVEIDGHTFILANVSSYWVQVVLGCTVHDVEKLNLRVCLNESFQLFLGNALDVEDEVDVLLLAHQLDELFANKVNLLVLNELDEDDRLFWRVLAQVGLVDERHVVSFED